MLLKEHGRNRMRAPEKTVRANVTIYWTVRANVRVNLRVQVKRRHAAVRLPARRAGAGDADGVGAGGAAG